MFLTITDKKCDLEQYIQIHILGSIFLRLLNVFKHSVGFIEQPIYVVNTFLMSLESHKI